MKPYQTITNRGTLWIHEHFATAEEAEKEGYHFFFEDESNGPIYSMQMDDEGLYFHYARITDLHRYRVPCHWEMKGYLNVNARSVEEALEMAKEEGINCILPLEGASYVEDTLEIDTDAEPIDITEDGTHRYSVNSVAVNEKTKIISTTYLNAVSVEDAYKRATELLPKNIQITSIRRVADEL